MSSSALATQAAPGAANREMVVTIDDLPFNCTCRNLAQWRDLTTRLLAALEQHQVPAIGFVNEIKLYPAVDQEAIRHDPEAPLPSPERERVALLEAWLDSGHELGNHSFSHPDLHRTALAAFQQDVLRGQLITRQLLAQRGRTPPRFFRHPFLHSGRSVETKRALEQGDAEGNRRNSAPAGATGDLASRVVTAYLDYMLKQTEFFEAQSRKLLGRELPQVLLLHANRLNAAALEALLARLEGRGYSFIRLEQALADEAYQRPDNYTGAAGMSWLQRWAWAQGHRGAFFAGEPEVEPWVRELSGL